MGKYKRNERFKAKYTPHEEGCNENTKAGIGLRSGQLAIIQEGDAAIFHSCDVDTVFSFVSLIQDSTTLIYVPSRFSGMPQ